MKRVGSLSELWARGIEYVRARRGDLRGWWCLASLRLFAGLPITLRTYVRPPMSLLHVLLAVAFSLALIRTRMVLALEHGRRC